MLIKFCSALFNDAVNCRDCTASVLDNWMSVEHWWNGTGRGQWSIGGMVLTGESGAFVEWYCQGRVEHLWNGTDRGEWSIGGMVLAGESGALVEWHWQGRVEHWWNGTGRGQWSIGGMVLAGDSRSRAYWEKKKCQRTSSTVNPDGLHWHQTQGTAVRGRRTAAWSWHDRLLCQSVGSLFPAADRMESTWRYSNTPESSIGIAALAVQQRPFECLNFHYYYYYYYY